MPSSFKEEMKIKEPTSINRGFTLVELLVVLIILSCLTTVALPSYLASVNNSRQGVANANARAIATAVQSKALTANSYDTTLTDYAVDMGGSLPQNPCTATTTGYTITATTTTARIVALTGSNCGTWTAITYSLTL